MRTIGKFLKESRISGGHSLGQVSQNTKIKKEFISAIEKEQWGKLPPYPVVVGFVKNYSQYLGVDRGRAVATLRRDYPPSKLKVNPNPDLKRGRFWSPRFTFFTGVFVIVLFVLGYLGLQFLSFRSPPELIILNPRDGQVVVERTVAVVGKAQGGAGVAVNNQPANIDSDGNFEAVIELVEGEQEIEIVAESRSGRRTVERRRVVYEVEAR